MRVPARNGVLRACWPVAALCLALAAIGRADSPPKKPPVLCTIEANNCDAPGTDLRQAADAYWKGFKLREKDVAAAYDQFTEAARLVPGNVDYANARELAGAALAHEHIESGNRLLAGGRQVEAVAEFRAALELDPGNGFAQQRLRDALGDAAPRLSPGLRMVERSDPLQLTPRSGRADIHYRGDARGLYEMIARSFGVKAFFDPSFSAHAVRFDVEDVDFYKAMQLADMVSKSFWVPLAETQLLVAADTPEKHRELDRMSLRSFYVTQASSPQELNDIVGMLRSVFGLRGVSANAKQNVITVRAPQHTLEAATKFLNELSQAGPPQVLLDVQAFDINYMVLRNLGIQLPLQFNMYNLSQASALLASQSNQDLINQLIASGGINQANNTALTTLLTQLQAQQLSPLLSTPFATFGGGITYFGVTLPTGTANFQFNSSNVKNLDHLTLRAMQGKAATMRVGTRYPILNAIFSPISNSAAISQNIQNNTFQAAFPSFNYEDLGLTVKATPSIHGNSEVTLELETELRALTGQAFNGVPVISNRTYKSTITVKNGETAVVVGDLNRSEQVSLSGLPGLGAIPGFGLLEANQNKTAEDDEFLLIITPHIMEPPAGESQAVWLPAGS
jgi:general secretion pathway protein D